MTDEVDLMAWLRVQLDADEQAAREAADGDSGEWFVDAKWNVYRAERDQDELVVYGNVSAQSEHIAKHDPARVLREVAAKRRILDECDLARVSIKRHPDDLASTGWLLATIRVAKLLALAYADRPGYQAQWAPMWAPPTRGNPPPPTGRSQRAGAERGR